MILGMLHILSIIYLTIGVLILLLGILIFRENPNQRINRVTGIMMFLAALAPIMGAFGMLVKTVSTAIDFDVSIFNRIYLIWEFFFPQLLVFALIFPRESLLIKNHSKILPLIYIPHAIQVIILILFRSPESILSLIRFGEIKVNFLLQPLLIVLNLFLTLLSYLYEFHKEIFALVNLIYVLLAIFMMYQGYLQIKRPRLKQQVGLVLWGIRVSVGLYVITFLIPKIFPINVSEGLNYALTILALIIGPGSIALSIIKYQFLDIRLIIRRGVIFSLTSGLLVGLYLLIYGQTKRIVTAVLGVDIPIVEIVFLVLAVIFFQPILSSIEEAVEKYFVRDKSDHRNALQTLIHDVLHVIDIEQLKEKIVTTLTDELMLDNVKLIIKRDSKFKVDDEIEFSDRSEFISLMSCLTDPISLNEVLTKISNEHELQSLHQLNASLFFPLSHHDSLTGILCLGTKLAKAKFSAEEISLLKVLADQISVTLENIELYQERLERQRINEEIAVSREIQRMLLPHEIPQGNNFEISAINLPSKEVGGDYYDFVTLDERRIGISIGDISGKGIPGAILMSNLQAAFRAAALSHLSSAEVMERVNNQIARSTSPEKFATFLYGILNTKKLQFSYTNAGHNYPIWRKKNGDTRYLLNTGLVVGVQKDFVYQENKIKLDRGDVLVFYTDGITEAFNAQHDEFSEKHLLNIISNSSFTSAEELRNDIYEEVVDFTKGVGQYDDITLIVLHVFG